MVDFISISKNVHELGDGLSLVSINLEFCLYILGSPTMPLSHSHSCLLFFVRILIGYLISRVGGY